MDHYIDLHLLPDPEFPTHQLLSALCAKLHRALVQTGRDNIGISFPGHDEAVPSLGTHLRLHGSEAALSTLIAIPWLGGLTGLLRQSAIQAVPQQAQHRQVKRVQAKSSPERLRRRAMRRHGIDAATARARIPDTAAESLNLPFVQLASRSTGQPCFHLYIRHGPVRATPTSGTFSAYGLSKDATIPWF
ncbi:MAG: type I-F CRISPR-associated endoribonuclease Cas6/Csy4 [Lysobacterales bacterium CG17_big_fil_post_rev_8_21_14_2_50_64_11]|nr:MAG: type I-F CRISPR-associated endoribonuclease Cas6/Csy4 [Xanthomonadales bacterium CG17_big_fil_post_rev_8_21_14_2_50_64_11]